MSARTTKGAAPAALHQPFSWLHSSLSGDAHAEFLALTKTICSGVEVCIQLAQQNGLDQDSGDVPLLRVTDAESLLMLAAASAQLLATEAEKHIDCMNAHAMKGAAV
jgi:hypothetical protein